MKSITARAATNNGKPCWRVIVPKDLSDGKQLRLFFDSEEKAVAKVKELERDRGKMAAGFHRLSQQDQAKVLIALERAGGNPDTLLKAVEDYAGKRDVGAGKAIAAIISECLDSKAAGGLRPRYIHTLKCSLKNFQIGVGAEGVCEVTAEMVEKWLGSNDWSMATKRGYLTDVRTLFAFAMRRGYCMSNPAAAVDKPMVEQKPPGIHTVEQVQAVMKAALKTDRGLIGYLAPLYFGGLRPVEAEQLTKAHIHADYMEVTPEQSKTRRRRFVAMNETLKAWLSVKRVEYGPKNLKRRMLKLRKGLSKENPFPWPHDALRHSFCSYGLPKYGAAKIAEWAGHSEAILFAHYRERVKPADADKYWNILPPPPRPLPRNGREG